MTCLMGILTDFGTRAGYVAAMKGVVLSINPSITILDLSHNISKQAVTEAALFLENCVSYFPEEFIFLVVIDPGVGSKRKIIALKTRKKHQYFVGPDNGVFGLIMDEQGVDDVVELDEPKYWRSSTSHTFHGRDIMAPVAAHLSNGIPINEVGKRIAFESLHRPKILQAKFIPSKNEVHGDVIYIDDFGNIITNVKQENLDQLGLEHLEMVEILFITPDEERIKIEAPLHQYYAEAGIGGYLCLFNSENRFEVAIRNGNAANAVGMGDSKAKIVVKKP